MEGFCSKRLQSPCKLPSNACGSWARSGEREGGTWTWLGVCVWDQFCCCMRVFAPAEWPGLGWAGHGRWSSSSTPTASGRWDRCHCCSRWDRCHCCSHSGCWAGLPSCQANKHCKLPAGVKPSLPSAWDYRQALNRTVQGQPCFSSERIQGLWQEQKAWQCFFLSYKVALLQMPQRRSVLACSNTLATSSRGQNYAELSACLCREDLLLRRVGRIFTWNGYRYTDTELWKQFV